MTQKTESEILFENYCNQLNISCTPILRANSKTPDYRIIIGGKPVIAELKQLNKNKEDIALYNQARKSGSTSAWCRSDTRVRHKIQKASKQIKLCSEQIPTIVILYDNGTAGGLDATDIKTAMFGDEKVIVSIDSGNILDVTPIHAGGRKRMTQTCNKMISAIGLLYRTTSELTLSIFHNHFAANPINTNWFRHERFRHFRLSLNIYDWMEI